MVTVFEGRWDQVLWALDCFRVGTEHTAWGPYMDDWYKPYVMLSNPFMRMHCKFCYYCARGEGAVYFIFFTSYFLSSCNTLGIAFIIL